MNLGEDDGRIFAGNPGSTTVIVSNAGRSATVPVDVTSFRPVEVGVVHLPVGGSANNCDAEGSYCYIADGPAASISGGYDNMASGTLSSVSGGRFNEASGTFSSVSGGRADATGTDHWRAGTFSYP